MSPSEVAKLFAVISFYDTRHQANEGVILAWHQSLMSEIDFEFARNAIYAHYANSEAMIQPSHINARWKLKVKSEKEKEHGERLSREFEEANRKAVSPEKVKAYVEEIKKVIRGEA